MICPYCGFENERGAHFCKHCGKPQNETPPYAPPQDAYGQSPYAPPQDAYGQSPYAPPQDAYGQSPYAPPQDAYGQSPYAPQDAYGQSPYAPQPAYNQPPYAPAPIKTQKKKKAGLIIGICAGIVVVAAVLALVLLLPSGLKVEGYWVSDSDGIVLSVNQADELTMYSLSGTIDADYDFDKTAASGSFKADSIPYEFSVDGDRLKLTNTGTDKTFKLSRADKKPDIEEIVTAPLTGLWTNDSNGEVLEFLSGGKANTHSPDGEYEAGFEFDIENGQGTFKVLEYAYPFTSDGQTMTLEDIGTYQKVAANFDIASFVSEHSNPLSGVWYDQAGVYGTLEFMDDSTFTLVIYGVSTTGTYTYDSAAGSGTLNTEFGDSGVFTCANGTLALEGITYTHDYVAQQTTPDYSALTGEWYESVTGGSVSFYADGTFYLYIDNSFYFGNFTFDPITATGTITSNTDETLNYYIQDGALYLEGVMFTRETSTQSSDIDGFWYDQAGALGTIYLNPDGNVEMYSKGTYVYGTYTYDAATATGSITLEYEGESYQSSFTVTNGLLLVDGVTYTKDYVAQPA